MTQFERFMEKNANLIKWLEENRTEKAQFIRDFLRMIEYRRVPTAKMIQAAHVMMRRDSAYVDSCKREHFGAIGERGEATARIIHRYPMAGKYGPQCAIQMQTTDGHNLKYISARDWAFMVPIGKEMKIRFTVRTHAMYQGAPETLITRVEEV